MPDGRNLRDASRVARPRVAVAPERVSPRRSVGSRFSTGHVVMVVAGLLGLLLSLSVLRRADNTVPVVVVTRDVVPGTRLRPEMVGTTRVHADDRSLGNLVAADDRDTMIGSIVLASLRAGDLLERSGVGPASTGRGAIGELSRRRVARRRRRGGGRRPDRCARLGERRLGDRVTCSSASDVVAVHAIGSGPLRGATVSSRSRSRSTPRRAATRRRAARRRPARRALDRRGARGVGALVRRRGRRWLNRRSRSSSRPIRGSRRCTGTAATTAARASANSSSTRCSRSTRSTRRS